MTFDDFPLAIRAGLDCESAGFDSKFERDLRLKLRYQGFEVSAPRLQLFLRASYSRHGLDNFAEVPLLYLCREVSEFIKVPEVLKVFGCRSRIFLSFCFFTVGLLAAALRSFQRVGRPYRTREQQLHAARGFSEFKRFAQVPAEQLALKGVIL